MNENEVEPTPPDESGAEEEQQELTVRNLTEALYESPETSALRQQLAERLKQGELNVEEFAKEYYVPIQVVGERLVDQMAPNQREGGQIQLAVHLAHLQVEGGFKDYAIDELYSVMDSLRDGGRDFAADMVEMALLRLLERSEYNDKRFAEIADRRMPKE